MSEIIVVADTIHALAAEPSATLSTVLAGLEQLRAAHGDDVVITALATELKTATARHTAKSAGDDSGTKPNCIRERN